MKMTFKEWLDTKCGASYKDYYDKYEPTTDGLIDLFDAYSQYLVGQSDV